MDNKHQFINNQCSRFLGLQLPIDFKIQSIKSIANNAWLHWLVINNVLIAAQNFQWKTLSSSAMYLLVLVQKFILFCIINNFLNSVVVVFKTCRIQPSPVQFFHILIIIFFIHSMNLLRQIFVIMKYSFSRLNTKKHKNKAAIIHQTNLITTTTTTTTKQV